LSYCRTYNQIIDVADITPESGTITEPVSLVEMKNFLRLEGFEDDNESGEMPFDSDDALIQELITAAREGLEKFCGRSIVPHTWKVLLTNLAGDIELPYSNGVDLSASGGALDSILDCNGNDIDDYDLIGTEFLYLQSPLKEKMTLVYSVEPIVPKRLKQAIMRDVSFHYENRNDSPGELSEQAQVMASKYKRVSTWLS
jgi:hypothetical protein